MPGITPEPQETRWATAAADEEPGFIDLPPGNSPAGYQGSNRPEAENEYATFLVALEEWVA